METISFAVEGKPQGKGRPQYVRATGVAHTPKETREYERRIRSTFNEVTGNRYKMPGCFAFPAGVPVRLIVRAYYPIPKSTSKRMRQAMLDGDVPCTRKPDLDNVLKVVADGINPETRKGQPISGGAYADDAQITHIHAIRRWSETPRIEVELSEVK